MKISEMLLESEKCNRTMEGKSCPVHGKKDCRKVNEDITQDPGEYDQEGDMAQRQLTTAADAAEELRSILTANENLPEWVQQKISLAVDYLDTARDYMKSTKDVDEELRGSFRNNMSMDRSAYDTKGAGSEDRTNILIQLKRNIALHGKHPIEFHDGSTLKLSSPTSQKIMFMIQDMLPKERHVAINRIVRSKDEFISFVKDRGIAESKQKGVDGKACWDGYKRMGTKKKGSKTVDNCVPTGK